MTTRSAVLLSVVSVAVLGLLGWVKHETQSVDVSVDTEEEHILFVG